MEQKEEKAQVTTQTPQRGCHILFPSGRSPLEPKDDQGCILPTTYNGPHQFIDSKGRTINWEDDENCKCGCQEEDGYRC